MYPTRTVASSLGRLAASSQPRATANASRLVSQRRCLSASSVRLGGGGNHYEPPSGWLWGVPPGQKVEPEGWESIWYWGFFGSLALTGVAYAFKPDSSIQTWALEEARRRLEQEGVLSDSDEPKKA